MIARMPLTLCRTRPVCVVKQLATSEKVSEKVNVKVVLESVLSSVKPVVWNSFLRHVKFAL